MNMVGQYSCGFSEKKKIGIMKIHQELAVLSEFEEVQMRTEKTKNRSHVRAVGRFSIRN